MLKPVVNLQMQEFASDHVFQKLKVKVLPYTGVHWFNCSLQIEIAMEIFKANRLTIFTKFGKINWNVLILGHANN